MPSDLHLGSLGVPKSVWEHLPFVGSEQDSATETEEGSDDDLSDHEYDGPRLGEPVKFTVLFGPEQGVGIWPAQPGAIYVTPLSVYQYRGDEWVDLEVDSRAIYRAVATYIDPETIRRQKQRQMEGYDGQ